MAGDDADRHSSGGRRFRAGRRQYLHRHHQGNDHRPDPRPVRLHRGAAGRHLGSGLADGRKRANHGLCVRRFCLLGDLLCPVAVQHGA